MCEPLKPPENFPFPFPPYDIQEQLMIQVFQALEGGKLAILESPTGTVSLSMVNMCLITKENLSSIPSISYLQGENLGQVYYFHLLVEVHLLKSVNNTPTTYFICIKLNTFDISIHNVVFTS